MSNELDEVTGSTNPQGRDVNVIEKQIRVEVGTGSLLFEVALWTVGTVLSLIHISEPTRPY